MFPTGGPPDYFDLTRCHQEDLRAEAEAERLVRAVRASHETERQAARRAAHLHRHVTWEILRHELRIHLARAHPPRRHAVTVAIRTVPTRRVLAR